MTISLLLLGVWLLSQEMKSLRAEIKLLQELQHPRIVQYLGSEDTDGVLSIFMEYLPGVSMHVCLE